jgi:hypothetical protein
VLDKALAAATVASQSELSAEMPNEQTEKKCEKVLDKPLASCYIDVLL